MTCFLNNCNKKTNKFIGKCSYCLNIYCMKHRLPEVHNCENINLCKRKAFKDNEKLLKKQKCIQSKLYLIQ